MFKRPFTIAVLITFAGAVPFIVLAAIALLNPASASTAVQVLISYAAVILSFLGAVHWGFALRATAHPVNDAPPPPAALGAERQLLILGVIPAIFGWAALSLMLHFNSPAVALFVLLAGFFITIVAETIGRGRGVVASNYLALRWAVSVIVLLALAAVLAAVLWGMPVSVG